MIREVEVKYVISNEIPALAIDLSMVNTKNDLYKCIECLTDYTKELIREIKYQRWSNVSKRLMNCCMKVHHWSSLL